MTRRSHFRSGRLAVDRNVAGLRWIASGRRQAEAALLMELSERTIENHLRRIRQRLGASSTAQAIRMIVQSDELER